MIFNRPIAPAAIASFVALLRAAAVAEPTAAPTRQVSAGVPAEAVPGALRPLNLPGGTPPFDVIVDVKFPPQPVPTPQATPFPPGEVPAPRYPIGLACQNLAITLTQITGYQGTPGAPTNQQAVLTKAGRTQIPTSNSGIGLACATSFANVTRGLGYYLTFTYKGAPIAFAAVPAGSWSNPVTLSTTDPLNPVTHTQYREVSIALPQS